MAPPATRVTSREEHDRLRAELLVEEKALTRAADALAARRRELPWVKIDKEYVFKSLDGRDVGLSDLFGEGKQDLVVYHFMFDPSWEQPCDHCCCWTEGFHAYMPFFQDKFSFAIVAKAGVDRLRTAVEARGWSGLPVYSSGGNDFNADFKVEDGVMKSEGKEFPMPQLPGMSVFRKAEDGVVYHTYSTYQRGLENFNAIWAVLDILPDGREGWHPKHKAEYSKKRKEPENGGEVNARRKSQKGAEAEAVGVDEAKA